MPIAMKIAMTIVAVTVVAGSDAQAFAATCGLAPERDATAAQTLRAGEIESHVAGVLQSRLREAGSGARIDRVTGVRDLCLPPGEAVLAVGAIAGRWPRKTAAAPVSVHVGGRIVRVFEARVEASDPRTVLVYAEARVDGTPAAGLALTTATLDLVDRQEALLISADALAGLRTRRAVRAGQPVLRSDFESEPDVARRAQVEIEVRRGAVRIATTGIALADARVGEPVAVLPMNADAAVTARVRAKQKVEIDVETP